MIHVVYVPGLGDNPATFQRGAVWLWRLWGVKPHIYRMYWEDAEPYETKIERLLRLIDDLSNRGQVVLVGASAGATAVINAYSVRPDIAAVICIAGKVNNPQAIGSAYRTRTPTFWNSAQKTPQALSKLSTEQKRRILSVRATTDRIVPARDSIIDGAHNTVTWTRGHALTIASQLVFGAPSFLRFAKRQIDR